jgi:hypothetical protein
MPAYAYVRLWHKADMPVVPIQCPLLGVKRTYIGEHQSPKSGSRCRTVAMPGLLIEELKAWRATQAQEPIAPRHSPRSRHSHLTPNMQADAAARLDVALRAAKKC